MPEPEQGLKLFTKKAFVVTGIVLGLAALFFMRTLVLMVFLALLIAILWDALTGFFVRISGNRLPRTPMLAVSILLSLSVVGGAGALLTVPLRGQFRDLVEQIPALLERLRSRVEPILSRYGLDELGQGASGSQGFWGDAAAGGVQAIGIGVVGLVGLITVLFVAFFFALHPDNYHRGVLRLVPPSRRQGFENLTGKLHETLIQWLKAAGITMIFIGIATGIALWLIGVPYALLFGVIAGVLELIPYLGPFLAFLGPFLLAASDSTSQVVWVIIAWTIVQGAESNIITPAVMAKKASLPPALTLIAIVGLGQLFGFMGVLLAPPLLAVILVVLDYLTPEL
jgi:predicted PurR-regulated permease PerM